MDSKTGKRIGVYISEKLLDLCDATVEKSGADSRSEFICNAINHGSFDNPQMQTMLVQLADRLAKAKGKMQYGYLNTRTKKLEELPLPDPVPPRVDFSDDGSDVYPKAVRSLREPEVEPSPEESISSMMPPSAVV